MSYPSCDNEALSGAGSSDAEKNWDSPERKRILVVDDDRAVLHILRAILTAQGWAVETVQTPERARALVSKQTYDLIVSDIDLGSDETGMDLLRSLRDDYPVILITGFGSMEVAVNALREGAWDFISKPFEVHEVVATVRRAIQEREQVTGGGADSPAVLLSMSEEAGLLGRSSSMIELFKKIARIAPARSTVLISGESGTGKELVAKAVHRYSERSEGPFIPVNCGALTETLLEAELFGHTRGSFTGAHADRRGLWEEAGGGTLFLDEIGEMSPAMQVKLLRALQEGEVRRVGASRPVKVDARVIAATNRDLEAEVKAGRFRQDLYYRLSVVTLKAPPLRERRGDIPALVERFQRNASLMVGRPLSVSEEALGLLVSYDWPGNVRELESAVESAALNARGEKIAAEDLPEKLQVGGGRARAATRASFANLYIDFPSLDELERRYLVYLLDAVGGSRTRAAEILRINRRTLYRMAERFGIALESDERQECFTE